MLKDFMIVAKLKEKKNSMTFDGKSEEKGRKLRAGRGGGVKKEKEQNDKRSLSKDEGKKICE